MTRDWDKEVYELKDMDKLKLEKQIYEYLKKTQLYKTSARIKKNKKALS